MLVTQHWTDIPDARRPSLAVDGFQPRYLAQPANRQDFAATLAEANTRGLAVLPRGGGTHTALGNLPVRADLVLDTTGLDRLVEYEPADLTVTVEAGMRLASLQALLREQGQMLALDPPAMSDSTIGGIVAANASGPLRYGYGTARDLLIGCQVANPDGRITRAGGRVVKNVAGYDLNKLYVGSLGTLAVLVELSFKLHPIPPADSIVVAEFASLDQARQVLQGLVRSPLQPMAIVLLDSRAARHAGLGSQPTLALRVGGYPAAVSRLDRDLVALIQLHAGSTLDVTYSTWEDVQRLGQPTAGGPDVLVKAAVPIARSVDAMRLLEEALAPFEPRVWAYAGSGVAYASLPAASDPSTLQQAITTCRVAVGALGSNASLVVERCPPTVKQGFDVWGEVGPSLAVMRSLKQQLDPRNTLNPGRFVGGI